MTQIIQYAASVSIKLTGAGSLWSTALLLYFHLHGSFGCCEIEIVDYNAIPHLLCYQGHSIYDLNYNLGLVNELIFIIGKSNYGSHHPASQDEKRPA